MNNKPSEIQKAKLKLINNAGGIGIVAYSVDDVAEVLKEVDRHC